MRKVKKDKDISKGFVAESLTNNRLTLLCDSTITKKGLSSVNIVQAQLAVEYAAKVY